MPENNTPEFEVAIGNVVEVPVKFTLNDGNTGQPKTFKFNLVCKRLDQADINARLVACENRMIDFMSGDLVTGWNGQRLVLDKATGQPVDFSQPALDAMLKVAGVASVSFTAYMSEVGAKQKN